MEKAGEERCAGGPEVKEEKQQGKVRDPEPVSSTVKRGNSIFISHGYGDD